MTRDQMPNPDPLHIEPVEPGPVRARAVSDSNPAFAMGCLILAGALLVGLAAGLLIGLMWQSAPRSAAEPSSPSVRPSSGVPSTHAVSPDSALLAVGPTSGGAPPPPAAVYRQPTTLVASEPASCCLGVPAEALHGYATWYAYHPGQAAAGPALRRFLGKHWRGQAVTVCRVGGVDPVWDLRRCRAVILTDACACGARHGLPTLIDLDRRDFAAISPVGRGVLEVSVARADGPSPTLPSTDTAP